MIVVQATFSVILTITDYLWHPIAEKPGVLTEAYRCAPFITHTCTHAHTDEHICTHDCMHRFPPPPPPTHRCMHTDTHTQTHTHTLHSLLHITNTCITGAGLIEKRRKIDQMFDVLTLVSGFKTSLSHRHMHTLQ